MRLSEHFILQELVPKHVYEKYQDDAIRFVSPFQVRNLEVLRKRFGKIFVNTWIFGGRRNWSGYRDPSCPFYQESSLHPRLMAFDAIGEKVTAHEMRQDIILHPEKYEGITRVEGCVDWLHADGLITRTSKIIEFMPNKKIINEVIKYEMAS